MRTRVSFKLRKHFATFVVFSCCSKLKILALIFLTNVKGDMRQGKRKPVVMR